MCVYMCVQSHVEIRCWCWMTSSTALSFIFETRALTEPEAHQPDQISWPVQWPSCLYPLSIWIIGKSHCSQFFAWVLGTQVQILIAKQALFPLNYLFNFCALELKHTSIQAGHIPRIQGLPVIVPYWTAQLWGFSSKDTHWVMSVALGSKSTWKQPPTSCTWRAPAELTALQPGTELLGVKSVRILILPSRMLVTNFKNEACVF